jgi:serine/threonine protein kinase
MAESLVGRNLGQYRIVEKLGRGQHTTVYKAWQTSLERHVALKVLHNYDQKTLQKFQAEARLTAQLVQQRVPNIRQVYEVGQDADGYLFVAMEYVDDSLRNVLNRSRERNRRIKPVAAVNLLQPVAQALDALHSLGWVHLDIKPQNILIASGGRAVLADFGIAQRRGMMTHACTPMYASPEQATGDRPVGPWSDIYSLGVVLYEMVAGHPPVRGDQDIVLLNQHLEMTPPSPRRVNPQLSASQERAIYKALAKSSGDRFRTAGEFLQAMTISDTFLSSMIRTPTMLLERSSSRAPRWAFVGVILVLVLAVLLVAGWILWPRLSVGTPTATPTATVATPTVTTVPTTAVPTKTAVPPTETAPPTATLAVKSTRTPRPAATASREATLAPTVTGSPSP